MVSFDNLELAQGGTCPVSEPAVEVHLTGWIDVLAQRRS